MAKTAGWQGLRRRVQRRRLRRCARSSLLAAYAEFARRHPRWTQSLFDRYLLLCKVAPLLEEGYGGGPGLTARTLAAAWAGQIARDEDERRRLAAAAMRVSEDFVALLEAPGAGAAAAALRGCGP